MGNNRDGAFWLFSSFYTSLKMNYNAYCVFSIATYARNSDIHDVKWFRSLGCFVLYYFYIYIYFFLLLSSRVALVCSLRIRNAVCTCKKNNVIYARAQKKNWWKKIRRGIFHLFLGIFAILGNCAKLAPEKKITKSKFVFQQFHKICNISFFKQAFGEKFSWKNYGNIYLNM